MTKICVTSTGPTLDSSVDPRFGRCAYFVVVDTDTMKTEAIQNDAAFASGGAGIRAAQTVVSLGINAIITGSIGPNAYPALQTSGIRVFVFTGGTVQEAVDAFKQGILNEMSKAGPSHIGLGGLGRGGGRGRGRGGGRW